VEGSSFFRRKGRGVRLLSAKEKTYFDLGYLGALLGSKGAETLKNRSKILLGSF
jgi:hypothetical protein